MSDESWGASPPRPPASTSRPDEDPEDPEDPEHRFRSTITKQRSRGLGEMGGGQRDQSWGGGVGAKWVFKSILSMQCP